MLSCARHASGFLWLLCVGLLGACGHGGASGGDRRGLGDAQAAGPIALDVPAPAGTTPLDAAAVAGVPPSQLVMRLQLPLAQLQTWVDAAAPGSVSRDFYEVTAPGSSPRLEARYTAVRQPLKLAVSGRTVRVTLPVHYWADLRGALRNPLPFGGRSWFPLAEGHTWGTRNDPQVARVHIDVSVDIGDDYRVTPAVTLQPIEHGPPPAGKLCVDAGIQICTPKDSVAPMVRRQIERELLPQLRSAVASMKAQLGRSFVVRPLVEQTFELLDCPISLASGEARCAPGPVAADEVLLQFTPGAIQLADPQRVDDALVLDVGLSGSAALSTGAYPARTTPSLPPPLRVPRLPPTSTVQSMLRVPYATLASVWGGRLAAAALPVGDGRTLGATLTALEGVRDAEGQPRMLLQLRLAGPLDGTIYLWGVPAYDREADTLQLADLRYSAQTAAQLAAARGVDTQALLQGLRGALHYAPDVPFAQLLQTLQRRLAALSPAGVTLRAQPDPARVATPQLGSGEVLIPVSLRGEVSVVPFG